MLLNWLMVGGGYLLGAVPFGVIVARSMGVDILAVGSGNIGATNVWRTLGPKAGTAVFILDVLKGFGAAYGGRALLHDNDWGLYIGAAAILGHTFSPYIRFKGGKAVATTLGVLIAVAPMTAGIALSVFLLVVVVSRYISLGSIAAAVTVIGTCFALHLSLAETIVFSILALMILAKHIPNMKRLLIGTESRFEFKSKSHSKSGPTDSQEPSPTPHSDPAPRNGERAR